MKKMLIVLVPALFLSCATPSPHPVTYEKQEEKQTEEARKRGERVAKDIGDIGIDVLIRSAFGMWPF